MILQRRRGGGIFPLAELTIPFFGFETHITIHLKIWLIRKWIVTEIVNTEINGFISKRVSGSRMLTLTRSIPRIENNKIIPA